MKIGLALDLGSESDVRRQIADAQPLLDLAEQAGVDGVWLGESYHTEPRPFHLPAPLITLAYLAGVTGLGLGTGVLLFRAYDTRRLAYECALVDQLCGGRLKLGIGLGNTDLRGRIGYDGDNVGQAFDEGLASLKQAWSGGEAASDGSLVAIPGPAQAGGPKMLVGGRGTRAVERALKHGDGYYAATNYSDALLELRAKEYWRQNSSGSGEVVVNRLCLVHQNGLEAQRRADSCFEAIRWSYSRSDRWGLMSDGAADLSQGVVLAGTPLEIRERLTEYASWGVTGVQLRVAPIGVASHDALETVELVASVMAGVSESTVGWHPPG